MRILAVSGATSRAGKTAAAVSLLRALPGSVALKFTTTEDVFERCPRGTPCVVCDIDVPFRIVDDPAVLTQAGTDTARFGEAGACEVLWVIARQGAVATAWSAARTRIATRHGEDAVVVLEGSSIVATAQPQQVAFVVHPFLSPSRWKETTPALLRRADLVLVNRTATESREPSPEVLAALSAHGVPNPTIADATSPAEGWASELLRDVHRPPGSAGSTTPLPGAPRSSRDPAGRDGPRCSRSGLA